MGHPGGPGVVQLDRLIQRSGLELTAPQPPVPPGTQPARPSGMQEDTPEAAPLQMTGAGHSVPFHDPGLTAALVTTFRRGDPVAAVHPHCAQ